MTRRATVWMIAVVALCAVAGVWRWRALQAVDTRGVLIEGGDGGGLPRAAPALEGFDEHALHSAVHSALEHGSSALLVMRHGHLVLEQYGRGADASTPVDGGELAYPLLIVASGIAVAGHGMTMPAPPLDADRLAAAIAAASGQSYPLFLSRRVWQPLNAAPARWLSPGVSARATDWLRVAELLLHDGRFEGRQVVQRGWVERHIDQLSGPGSESPSADGVIRLHGPGATRLWLVPRFDVAILRVATAPPAGGAVDEALAHTIISTLRDRPVTGGASLNDLVPGH